MKNSGAIFLMLSAVACAPQDEAVTALATRLAYDHMPVNASPAYRTYGAGYIPCGEKALSNLPRDRIEAALRAPDASSVWAVLGSDALDRYVARCREVDLKRDPPPPR